MLYIFSLCVFSSLVAIYTTLNQLCLAQVPVTHQRIKNTKPNILQIVHDDFVWNKQTLYLTSHLSHHHKPITSTNLFKASTRHKRSSLNGYPNKYQRSQSQTTNLNVATKSNQTQTSAKTLDACQSDMEVITPYFAKNSRGKLRVVVNTELLQQAIQIETCRCFGECGCEQKYKWHRLLVHDPSNLIRGLFTDWFLYPSTCVCRCLSPSSSSSSAQFIKLLAPQTANSVQP